MPIYEYACSECGHHLDARQKFSDPPLTTCPSCGAEGLERLISESSFSLKGGGWYADGYGPGGKKSDGGSSSASSASSSSSSSESKKADAPAASTSDSKPASDKPKSGGSPSSAA